MFKMKNESDKKLNDITPNSKSSIPELNFKKYKNNCLSSNKKGNLTERTINNDRITELCQPKKNYSS